MQNVISGSSSTIKVKCVQQVQASSQLRWTGGILYQLISLLGLIKTTATAAAAAVHRGEMKNAGKPKGRLD